MACCFKSKSLSDLDPVTFFIVTEMMRAEQEQRNRYSELRREVEPTFECQPQIEAA